MTRSFGRSPPPIRPPTSKPAQRSPNHTLNTRSTSPTLHDVARAAGVSRQTVSNVLHAPDRVRPETRARVLTFIADLGYQPNRSAQASKPSSISPLISFASLSATTASVHWSMARSLSLTKSRPLTNSSIAPSPPKSSSVASSNTCSHRASSRSVTMVCLALLIVNCY